MDLSAREVLGQVVLPTVSVGSHPWIQLDWSWTKWFCWKHRSLLIWSKFHLEVSRIKITHPYFIVIYIHDHTTYVRMYVRICIHKSDWPWRALVSIGRPSLNSQALQGSALLGAGSLWLQTCEVQWRLALGGYGISLRCCFPLITDWVGWISLGFGCVCFYDKMHATDLCGRFFCLFQGLILSMGAFLCTSNLRRWITASLGMCPSANSHLQSDVVEKHGTNTVGQS